MGFMDRMKGGLEASEQARKMAAGMPGGGMPTAEDMADMNRFTKLNASGVEKTAVVKALAPTGKADPGGGLEHAVTVEVEADPSAGQAGYEATFRQSLVDVQMKSLGIGSRIIVKVDPDAPNSMIFWSTP